jgi:DNA-binding response OmpR family regulator
MDKKRILVVEDETTLQKVLADVLLEESFEVEVASNGEDGLKAATEKKPDLILLDIILPKKDGFEVLQELKRDPKTKMLPVILLTNLSDPNDIQRAIDLGAKTYLVKSEYQLKDVVEKVKETLKI